MGDLRNSTYFSRKEHNLIKCTLAFSIKAWPVVFKRNDGSKTFVIINEILKSETEKKP